MSLVGDKKYGPAVAPEQAAMLPTRLFLHAFHYRFIRADRRVVDVECPLPVDLAMTLHRLAPFRVKATPANGKEASMAARVLRGRKSGSRLMAGQKTSQARHKTLSQKSTTRSTPPAQDMKTMSHYFLRKYASSAASTKQRS